MKIGRYSAQLTAARTQSGEFRDSVLRIWEESDATTEKLVHFHKPFGTENEAKAYAEAQTLLRVKDGVW